MFLFWVVLKLSKLYSFCHVAWDHKSEHYPTVFYSAFNFFNNLLFQQCPYVSLKQR